MKAILSILVSLTMNWAWAEGTNTLKAFQCRHQNREVLVYPTSDRLNRQSYDSEGLSEAMPGWMLSRVRYATQNGAEFKVRMKKYVPGIGNSIDGEISINESTGVGQIKLTEVTRVFSRGEPRIFDLEGCKSIVYRFAGVASGSGWRLEKPYDWLHPEIADDTGHSGRN